MVRLRQPRRGKAGNPRRRQLYKSDQHGFRRYLEVLPEAHQLLNRHDSIVFRRERPDRHRELRRAYVAEHLELPVRLLPPLAASVSHRFRAIRKERVRYLVCNREIHTASRPVRVVLDLVTVVGPEHPRVGQRRVRPHRDTHDIRQLDWVERGTPSIPGPPRPEPPAGPSVPSLRPDPPRPQTRLRMHSSSQSCSRPFVYAFKASSLDHSHFPRGTAPGPGSFADPSDKLPLRRRRIQPRGVMSRSRVWACVIVAGRRR